MKARLVKQSGYEKYVVQIFDKKYWKILGKYSNGGGYAAVHQFKIQKECNLSDWHNTKNEAIAWFEKYKLSIQLAKEAKLKTKLIVVEIL